MNIPLSGYRALVVLLGLFVASVPCWAQNPITDAVNRTAVTTTDKTEPARKKVDIARRLSLVQKALEAAEAASAQEPEFAERLSRQEDWLRQRQIVLGQQKAAEEQKNELQATRQELGEKLDTVRAGIPIVDEPPSFLLLDRLRDELIAEETRKASWLTATQTAQQTLERAKASLLEKERARIQAKAAAEKFNGEPLKEDSPMSSAVDAQKLTEHESELATDLVGLREMELSNELLAQDVQKLRIEFLRARIGQLGKDTRFTHRELDDRLDEIRNSESELKYELETANHNAETLESQWVVANLSPKNHPAANEKLEGLRLARQSRQRQIDILNKRLDRLGKSRIAWQRRYDVISGSTSSADVDLSQIETQQVLEQLRRDSDLQKIRADELRKDLAAVEAKLSSMKDHPSALVSEIEVQRDHLQELGRVYDLNFVSIDACRRLHEKLTGELKAEAETASLMERAAVVWRRVIGIWNYPLAAVEERPITPGKIGTGMVLLLLGYWASGIVSRWLGQRLLPRLGMNEMAAVPLQSFAFYVLIATFTLFSLRVVNVPLTVFQFLGGALAIGVGFGSQNVVNNFISGLIMLAERPVRVGDVIQLDDLYGTVSKIGTRSTRVTTATNLEIIIPNSTFLERNVINWTLSDDRIRTCVKVEVAYGSPTREVTRLLNKAAIEHGLIMKSPAPAVWFSDFAKDAMRFELHFWIRIRALSERMTIESDIRHRIDSMFREAGIIIAYPQRDVHLDVTRPISLRLLAEDAEMLVKPIQKQAG